MEARVSFMNPAFYYYTTVVVPEMDLMAKQEGGKIAIYIHDSKYRIIHEFVRHFLPELDIFDASEIQKVKSTFIIEGLQWLKKYEMVRAYHHKTLYIEHKFKNYDKTSAKKLHLLDVLEYL